ncbi:MAG: NAD kinase [Aeromicrobium sp.]
MKGRTVLLVVHVERDEATKIAATFANDLIAAGVSVRVFDADAALLRDAGLAATSEVEVVESGEGASEGCELAVVFGGDGTILRAAEMCRGSGTPVLGVNLGHVGFLAEADVEDVHELVRRVAARSWTVEERLTIDVRVTVGGEVAAQTWALNEASVEKASRERMVDLVVEIDARPVSRWGGDGVVCATPTGSTAYNFSAGGPVVWPEVHALLMVPISAHALFARPLVVSPDSTLAIEVVGTQSSAVLWCDGRRTVDLPLGARVEVVRGHEPVRLARLHTAPFADRLVRKFDLPVQGWRGAAEQRRNGS